MIYSLQLEWKVIIRHVFYSWLWLCRLHRLNRLSCRLYARLLVGWLLISRLLRLCWSVVSSLLSFWLSSEKLECVCNDLSDIPLVAALVVP
jgi:hypothetical protein